MQVEGEERGMTSGHRDVLSNPRAAALQNKALWRQRILMFYSERRPAHYRAPPVYSSSNKPLVFFWNIGNMHWNLVRVQTGLRKQIEIYEPMGKLASRSNLGGYSSEGLSLRSVPRDLITWLDRVCPCGGPAGWRARTFSAITSQHQGNGFDCGVACLLYAEKCGQGQEKEDISRYTNQEDITSYRALLRSYLAELGKQKK